MFIKEGRLSQDSVLGWRAGAVPGTVMGYEAAHKTFGTKAWAELLQPAIHLAMNGHPLSYMRAEAFRSLQEMLLPFSGETARQLTAEMEKHGGLITRAP